jgi:predicted transcriptional regulator
MEEIVEKEDDIKDKVKKIAEQILKSKKVIIFTGKNTFK